MNRRAILSLGLLVLLALPARAAGPLDDKTTAYFVDHYGSAKFARNEGKAQCWHSHGLIDVKGQFSARRFKAGDLNIHVVFFLPSLKLASASYSLPHAWTEVQINAALEAYGANWKATRDEGIIKSWVAPDGTVAIYMVPKLYIQSKSFTELGDKTFADGDAQRKAVPKF